MRQTRNTPQRDLVRGLLEENYSHPTASEVYELARRENPSISRGTVYRNLNLLAEGGEITRLRMPLGPDHYDFQTQNHYHFVCRSCHRVLDSQIPYDDALNLATANVPGCKTEWHKLILVGLCPDCNIKKPQ
ncbi:MAG: transcriptional repressor [Oscillospiraceae bacterium]